MRRNFLEGTKAAVFHSVTVCAKVWQNWSFTEMLLVSSHKAEFSV